MSEMMYHWACLDCLACQVTTDRESAVKHGKAHLEDFKHRVEAKSWKTGPLPSDKVLLSSGVYLPKGG